MSGSDEPVRHVGVHHGLLGTVIEIRVTAISDEAAEAAEDVVVEEIRRLQAVFSAFDPSSELSRWRRGEVDEPSRELAALLIAALGWQERGRGTFNPMVGVLTETWQEAERAGVPPDPDVLAALARSITAPRYAVVDGRIGLTGDCRTLNLNAFAKGHVADAAAALVAGEPEIVSVVVNAGGDLVHRGTGAIRVGVEDPRRPFDNVPPAIVVALTDRAIATSGSARRGVRIGGVRHSHVLDPRTGLAVTSTPSVSVIASDAATADVVATIAGVSTPAEGIEFVDALSGVECCLFDADGALWRSAGWAGYEVGGALRA